MYKNLIFTFAAILFFTVYSFAHSPLKTTSPANGAVLNETPQMLQFIFAKRARVVKVVMTHKYAGAMHETKLELPNKAMTEELRLTPEFRGHGEYLIEWRALSEDGHALKGKFSFTVNDD